MPSTTTAAPDAATEPRWLTDDQQRTWRLYLAMNRMILENLERQMQAGSGIPMTYYMVLAMLSEAEGRTLRMSALAELLQASPSRTSHAIAKLENLGWVRRERCESDRRGANAVLTDAGFEVVRAAAPGHAAEVLELIFDRLTPEQLVQFREICATVLGRDQP